MKCMFCGSEDLSTIETHKNFSIKAKDVIGTYDGQVQEVKPVELEIPATRRKIRCNNCRCYFFTVEHFEKTTKNARVQKMIVADYSLFTDYGIRSDLTESEKADLSRLIQEL